MKKYLLSAMFLCGASSAYAQSSVTLYGIIDEGLNFGSNVGGNRSYTMATQNIQGERWGVTGAEDLGGGTKAIFTLENGFDLNTGKMGTGRMFGRQAFLGVSSNYGTITFGRQYEASWDYPKLYLAPFFIGVFGAHPMDNDNLQGSFRLSNAVKFRTADYGGFSAEVMYAFSNAAGATNQNSAWSTGAGYVHGPLSLGVSVTKLNHPVSNESGAVGSSGSGSTSDFTALSNTFVPGAVDSDLIVVASGAYQLGKVRLSLGYSHVQYDMATTVVRFDNYEADAMYSITPFLLFGGSFSYTDGRVGQPSLRPKWYEVSSVLDYSLSKRTDVYVEASYQRAAGDAQFANIYTIGASSNRNQIAGRLGIRHKF